MLDILRTHNRKAFDIRMPDQPQNLMYVYYYCLSAVILRDPDLMYNYIFDLVAYHQCMQ